jgi:hypothetical protein
MQEVEQRREQLPKGAKYAKKSLVFHAETMGHQVNIIFPWRALRLCARKNYLDLPTRSGGEPL